MSEADRSLPAREPRVYDSMGVAPSAAAYGVGPLRVGATDLYSDGASLLFSSFLVPSGGTADDHAVINAVVQDAPEYASIVLASGSTYTIDKTITLKRGQRLIGNGATIKRADGVYTTTSTTINSSTTQITVASSTGFRAGQRILIWQSELIWATGVIGSVNGSVISFTTVAQIFGAASVSGTNPVCLAGVLAEADEDGAILGVTFDGNRSTYTTVNWSTHNEVHHSASRVTIDGCKFINAAGEGIVEGARMQKTLAANVSAGNTTFTLSDVSGLAVGDMVLLASATTGSTAEKSYSPIASINAGASQITVDGTGAENSYVVGDSIYVATVGCVYTRNYFKNIGGNGVHFSGSFGSLFASNVLINTNIVATNIIGHAGGAIEWSRYANHTVCENNTITGTPLYGFGHLNTPDTSHATLRGNAITECDSGPINMATSAGYSWRGHRVVDNTIMWCGSFQAGIGGANPSGVSSDLIFARNKVYTKANTGGIYFRNLERACVADNIVVGADLLGYGILADSLKNSTVRGNVVEKYLDSIIVNQSSSSMCVGLLIAGNVLSGMNYRGIEVATGAGTYGGELSIRENQIKTTNSGVTGILARPKNVVQNNTTIMSGNNVRGIQLNDDTVAIGNTVRVSGTGARSCELVGTGGIAVHNCVNQAIYTTGATPDAQTASIGNITVT